MSPMFIYMGWIFGKVQHTFCQQQGVSSIPYHGSIYQDIKESDQPSEVQNFIVLAAQSMAPLCVCHLC